MNIQREIEELRKRKDEIVVDMKACITYTPNQENDLLCLMEQYLKAEKEERPRLFGQIRSCMDGESYDNPFETYYCYSVDDIDRFDQILSSILYKTKALCYNPSELKLEVQKAVTQLNHLNASCRDELIDVYRREKLMTLFEEMGKLLKYEGIKGTVNEYRTW